VPLPLCLSRRARAAIAVLAAATAALIVGPPAAASVPGGTRGPSFGPAAAAGPGAYWLAAADGGIFTFGGVPFAGSAGAVHLNQPIIGMASTPDGLGYWLVAREGGIFAFGDAAFHGSLAGLPPGSRPSAPVVAIASTADGGGYWITTSDGGVYSFGDAPFHGSRAGHKDPAPTATMAVTADGGGYWLVGADGAVFAFGDAPFAGGANQYHPAAPIVAMTPTRDGAGYWLATSNGGVYSFGSAAFEGAAVAGLLHRPVVGMATTPDGGGYWLVTSDGGILTFGDAQYRGSTSGRKLASAIVAIAVGHTQDPYQPGGYGFDISFPQCSGTFPSPPGSFAVIGVNDGKPFTHNPCFAAEAAWAGGQLTIYMNMSAPPAGDPASLSGPAGTCQGNDTGCMAYNYGFNAAVDAFTTATAVSASSSVWWLDVETANTWDPNPVNNARTIQGAIDALTSEGAVPGIYSTGFQFGKIAGSYAPAAPIWVATGDGPSSAVEYCSPLHAFGNGTTWLTQFQAPGVPYDQDYACPVT
jgi:hypothetical protein